MRGSSIPTWEAHTAPKIDEFFEWVANSAEVKQFDTIAIDSGSQLAEIIIARELTRHKDGRKAYGEMSRICMEWFSKLFFMPQKHIILICKQGKIETGKHMVNTGGVITVESTYQAVPYFPGNDLNIKVPHQYDEILYLCRAHIPGMQGEQRAIRTQGTTEVLARDRSGRLSELEPPDLSALFTKAMQ